MGKYIFEKIVLGLLIVGLILIIIAAIFKSSNKTEKNVDHTLVKMDRITTNFNVYYDKDTRVMYIVNYRGGTTVMVNPDGSPRLYKEDNDD